MSADIDKPAAQPKRRRWYQFSLRTLLVFMLVVGCGFGWLGIKVREGRLQKHAVDELVKLGGTVRYDYQKENGTWKLDAKPSGPSWLRNVLGGDFFDTVKGVYLLDSPAMDADLDHLKVLTQLKILYLHGPHVRDSALVNVNGLTQLQVLSLAYTQATDAGLVNVTSLTQLQQLSLTGTSVTDAGLAHLKDLTQLQTLSLYGTRATDVGLEHLNGFTQLKHLDLRGTQVTAAAVAEFKKAVPNCEVLGTSK